jgi:outer membrane protein assembly factor BamE (lipoprotein component of BamABCDE complex)
MSTSLRLRLGVALAALGVAACSPQVTNQGHRLDADSLAAIQPGVSSREQVYRQLGSPSSVGTFDRERWYYISQRIEQMSFYQREVTNQDVVTIEFDDSGIVSDVLTRDLSAALAVEPSTDTTLTLGNELTLLQQILGNVGRFNTQPQERGIQPRAPGP